jgi:hypothetical protein
MESFSGDLAKVRKSGFFSSFDCCTRQVVFVAPLRTSFRFCTGSLLALGANTGITSATIPTTQSTKCLTHFRVYRTVVPVGYSEQARTTHHVCYCTSRVKENYYS